MLDVQYTTSRDPEPPAPSCLDIEKEVQSSPSAHGITPRLTPITPATTPSTGSGIHASPASSVRSTLSGDGASSNVSGHSSGRSERSSLLILPSPTRSRIDPEYSARLGSQAQQQRYSQQSVILPPPYIARGATSSSIFRPTTTASPGLKVNTSSGSGSLLGTPDRSFRFSYSSTSLSASSSFVSSFGSITTPIGTPRRYSSQYQHGHHAGRSDRFIPSRATSNLNFSLWGDEREARSNIPIAHNDTNEANTDDRNGTATEDGTDTSIRNDSTGGSQQALLNELLRSELLGENTDPTGYYPTARLSGQQSADNLRNPLREAGNHFRFQSPRQAYLNDFYHQSTGPEAVVNSFSLTPMGSATSHRLLSTPQKRTRRIQKVPFKVLDAPALQDDFYLNLVDWSSQNVLAVGLGSCVYLWSACTSKVTKLCDLAQSEDLVTSVSWAQRGTHLAVGTNRGEVQLWDTIKIKKIRTMGGHSARIGTLSWTGPTLASGSRDRLIFLRDVRVQSQYTARLASHKQEVCGLKWSFDEPASLASGGNDNKLLVWDIKNHCQPVHRFADHTAAVKAITWSPHQHGLLASGGGTADRCIRFWNTLSGAALSSVDTGSQVCNLAWSQNCNELVSTHGYSLNQIVVWRYPSMNKVATLTGHTYRVLYLAMSPDGSTIVTGAGDETLRFWQVFPGPRSNDKSSANGLLFPNSPGSVVR